MKKIICLVLTCSLLLILPGISVRATTLYAPDGRTIDVAEAEVSNWKNVGWYDYPVTMIYTADGRNCVVSTDSVSMWESVGWIDGRKTTTIYAPDGRNSTIPLYQLTSYQNLGWHTEPVMQLYALDGRTIVIPIKERKSYYAVGWMEAYEYYLTQSFSGLMKHFNGFSYAGAFGGGGYSFTEPNKKFYFDFSWEHFPNDLGAQGMESIAKYTLPMPVNPDESKCLKVCGKLGDFFPMFKQFADSDGNISVNQMCVYFGSGYSYGYTEDGDYVISFQSYSPYLNDDLIFVIYSGSNMQIKQINLNSLIEICPYN